jgi:hypothetical protein
VSIGSMIGEALRLVNAHDFRIRRISPPMLCATLAGAASAAANTNANDSRFCSKVPLRQ